MSITVAQLCVGMTSVKPDRGARILPGLNAAMSKANITTPQQKAAFLAQVGWESGEFKYTREVWGPSQQQFKYERDQTTGWIVTNPRNTLAYRLGNDQPNDGFRFRGWGPLQITGRANTRAASQFIFGDDRLLKDPTLLDDFAIGCLGAAWYWVSRGLNAYAESGDFRLLTKRINGAATDGAPSHYLKRLAYRDRFLKILTAKE